MGAFQHIPHIARGYACFNIGGTVNVSSVSAWFSVVTVSPHCNPAVNSAEISIFPSTMNGMPAVIFVFAPNFNETYAGIPSTALSLFIQEQQFCSVGYLCMVSDTFSYHCNEVLVADCRSLAAKINIINFP